MDGAKIMLFYRPPPRHYIFRLQAANTADLRLRNSTPEARIVSAAHSKAT
jgi:hypothetical protein